MAPQRRSKAAVALRLLLASLALHAVMLLSRPLAAFLEPSAARPPAAPLQRRSVLLSSAAAAAGGLAVGGEPAEAFFGLGMDPNAKLEEDEDFESSAKPSLGIRPFKFMKPGGFKRISNPIAASGYLFRYVNDSYLTFITRAEAKPNATDDFNPQDVIDDYRSKFNNETGSSYDLISGDTKPYRFDEERNIKYYKIEYVVRTQLGFTYDTKRSLHFISIFAAAPESIYILNCQAQETRFAKDGDKLRKIVDSFAITG